MASQMVCCRSRGFQKSRQQTSPLSSTTASGLKPKSSGQVILQQAPRQAREELVVCRGSRACDSVFHLEKQKSESDCLLICDWLYITSRGSTTVSEDVPQLEQRSFVQNIISWDLICIKNNARSCHALQRSKKLGTSEKRAERLVTTTICSMVQPENHPYRHLGDWPKVLKARIEKKKKNSQS